MSKLGISSPNLSTCVLFWRIELERYSLTSLAHKTNVFVWNVFYVHIAIGYSVILCFLWICNSQFCEFVGSHQE